MPETGEPEPVYLTAEDIIELYAAIVEGSVRQATAQLRNRAGLESALARPAAYAHYENGDLALQAAVLAHGLAESQPFVDGNKRIALVAMLTFLEINGYRVSASETELADWMIGLSAGTPPEGLADRIRETRAQRP